MSIRVRLLLLLGLLFGIIVSIFAYRVHERRESDVATAISNLATHAQILVERQQDIVLHTRQFVNVLIATGSVERLRRNPRCSVALSRFIEQNPRFADVRILAPDGRNTCAAVPGEGADDPFRRADFARAVATSDLVVGGATFDRSADRWTVPFLRAFRDQTGRVQSVLEVMLTLGWIADETDETAYLPDVRLGLIDSDGVVLARRPESELYLGKNFASSPFFKTLQAQNGTGTAEAEGFDGVQRIYAFSHFAETTSGPIYLWVGLAKDKVTVAADKQFALALFVVYLLSSAAFASAWYGGERLLVRPMSAVIAAAQRLRGGDIQARTGIPHTADEIGQLAEAFDDMAQTLSSANETIRLNRSLRVLTDCIQLVMRAESERDLLDRICRTLVESGGYRMAWIGFAEDDPDKTVRPVASYGFEDGYLGKAHISYADVERGRGPTGTAIRTGKAQVNQNFEADPRMEPWRAEAIRRGYKASSALPLRHGDTVFGALTIYSRDVEFFTPEEIALLDELAQDLSFGIIALRTREENSRNRKRLGESMQATVRAVASVLEARDPYTAGHERRVSQLAMALGQELGLSEDNLRALDLAAVVHDIGKIQTPSELLTKPTRLSAQEYELIKMHAAVGYDILKNIDFPWPIADIIYQHHERTDGSGYPRGLKGDAILIEAKIIAVADVVEAMSWPRPYRQAVGLDAALDEIAGNAGKRYDALVADACIRLFREKKFAFEG